MKNNNKISLISIIILPFLLLLLTKFFDFKFYVLGYPFYLITFIYPITFLVSLIISKKTESKNSMWIIILSLVIQLFAFVIEWVLFGSLYFKLIIVTIIAFLFSQMIALFGYEILKETKRANKFIYLFFVLILATFVETIFYLVLFSNITVEALIIGLTIKIVYDLLIAKILEI